jgi:hypothetical protein
MEAFTSGIGDREAGRLLCHPLDRSLVDQRIQRIGQGTVVQSGSDRCLKIFEWHTGCPVLAGQAFQSSSTVTL